MNDQRHVTTRFLGVLCAAIAGCIIVETVLRWPDPALFHLSYVLIPLCALVSLVVLAVTPNVGAWLTVTLVCVGLISPFPMSYSYMLTMAIVVVIIWQDNRIAAAIAILSTVVAMLVDRKVLFGLGISDDVVISFAYCLIAILLGMAALWTADRRQLRERERQRYERQTAAASLHDRTTNDLANAIMLIDDDLERGDHTLPDWQIADLHTLRRFIQQAMTGTYQVIDTLDNAATSAAPLNTAEPLNITEPTANLNPHDSELP